MSNNGGWDEWGNRITSEVDDAQWLVNPKEATARALASGGRELAQQAGQLAAQHAAYASVATQMDQEFAKAYPDLMATDVERHAVGLAIKKCMGHPRFPEAVQNPRMRQKIFGLVAKLANEELGRNDAAVSQRPSDRMADELVLAGTPPERQREAMQEMIDLALGSNKRGW